MHPVPRLGIPAVPRAEATGSFNDLVRPSIGGGTSREETVDGEQAALKLWTSSGVRVLPGAYLAKEIDGQNPGKSYIRVALVAPKPEMVRGLTLLRDCLWP